MLESQFVHTHFILLVRVQELEAPQPHAGLRVHVDTHTVTRPEPQQLLHPAHPAAEAAGFPSIAASAHRKNGPHLPLCLGHATGPRTSSDLSHTCCLICVREESVKAVSGFIPASFQKTEWVVADHKNRD